MSDKATRTTTVDPVEGFDDVHHHQPTATEVDPAAVAGLGLDLELLRKYRELRDLQKQSTAEVTAFKEEADKIEIKLIELFSEAGMQNVNIDGRTIYLHRDVYARRLAGVSAEELQAALVRAGAGDLIKESVNGSTLSAYVRELTEDDDAPGLPIELDGILEPGERFTVRIIAGGAKSKSKTHSKG